MLMPTAQNVTVTSCMWCLCSFHQAQRPAKRRSFPNISLSYKCIRLLSMSVQVVSVVGSTASQQEDTHSQQVAAATLGAIAPAWLRSGKPISELAAAVVALLPSMLPHRRLPLLTALLAVLPQVSLQLCFVCALRVCVRVHVCVWGGEGGGCCVVLCWFFFVDWQEAWRYRCFLSGLPSHLSLQVPFSMCGQAKQSCQGAMQGSLHH